MTKENPLRVEEEYFIVFENFNSRNKLLSRAEEMMPLKKTLTPHKVCLFDIFSADAEVLLKTMIFSSLSEFTRQKIILSVLELFLLSFFLFLPFPEN